MMDVCVLGRIGYDLYAVEHNRHLAQVEHFSRYLGGSSANIAIGLARLGLRVGIIGCLGNDLLADYLLDVLSREEVDRQYVRLVEDYNTSLCLTEVLPPDLFPQVFYRSNPADSQVVLDGAELAYVRHARMFVTSETSLCPSPSRESTLRALSAAREAGLCTVFDVDYRASSWPSSASAAEAAHRALPWIDVVLGNEDELLLLTGESEVPQQAKAVFQGVSRLLSANSERMV
jgi:5-dehydro-2-deoxygluconokinase